MTRDNEDLEIVMEHLSNQISVNNHIENQAGRIFRIWLAFVGIVPTVAYVLVTAFDMGQFLLPEIVLPDLSAQAEQISNTFSIVPEEMSAITMVMTFLIGSIILLMGFINLFLKSPWYALQVFDFRVEEPSANFRRDIDSELYEMYVDRIEENNESLDEAREHWDKCHQSLRLGVKYVFVSLVLLLPMWLSSNPLLLIAIIYIFLILVIKFMGEELDWFSDYIVFDLKIDGLQLLSILTLILSFIVAFVLQTSNIYIFILFAGLIFPGFIPFFQVDKERLSTLLWRNAGISSIALVFILSVLQTDYITNAWFWVIICLGIIFWVTVFAISMMVLSYIITIAMQYSQPHRQRIVKHVADSKWWND